LLLGFVTPAARLDGHKYGIDLSQRFRIVEPQHQRFFEALST
jgi:hypothetical protein